MPSPSAQWREVPWEMRLTGTRCLHCGTPQYPPQRVCVSCHTKDEMEPYRFTDVPAKVFSFSHDYVMESADSPVTVTFVDFEGGGRIMCDMTDRDPEEVVVGHARRDDLPPALLRERHLQLLVEVPAGQMPAAWNRGLTVESIKDRVAIVGMGCVKFGENWGQSLDDMIVDAAYEAFEDAGIGPEDIQAAWWGSVFAGHTGQILAAPLKLGYIPVTHVENACATGSEAIRNAAYAVAAGIYDVVLAVGAEKLKDTGYSGLPQTRPGRHLELPAHHADAGGRVRHDGHRLLRQVRARATTRARSSSGRSPSRTTTTGRSTPRRTSSARSPWSRPSTRPMIA